MTIKWLGAVLILAGCAGTGFSIAAQARRETALLRQLLSSLGYMHSALAYEVIPLPQLCRKTSDISSREIRKIFRSLASELDKQIYPQADSCMRAALGLYPELPGSVRCILTELGKTLGRLDLTGQLQGLDAAREHCRRNLLHQEQDQPQRLRSYRTLGVCAGIALVILLM